MITGDYDRLQGIAKYNICAEHHTPLEVAWHSGEKCWVIRCGEGTHKKTAHIGEEGVEVPDVLCPGHYPDAVTRELSLTELHRAGEELPSFIEDKVKLRQRRRAMAQNKGEPKTEFALVPQTDLGTGALLTLEAIKALVRYADKYHLDPERGHVVLMYGKPYIGLDGYLYKAKQSKRAYSLSGRPLITEELKQRGYKENDLGHISRVKFLDTGQEFEGEGFITAEEIEALVKGKEYQKRYPIVAKKPGLMVTKRADWQALRRAFPIGETEGDKGDEVEGVK